MAISGSDLTCNNKDCKYYKKGLVITATWPLGEIDLVIETGKENKDYYEGMLKLKEQGRKYACLNLPNKNNIPILGYRIQLWCDKCKSIRLFDALIKNPNETQEETIKNANISTLCPVCNTRLKSFSEITSEKGEGISCLSCGKKMKTNVWFCNEKE